MVFSKDSPWHSDSNTVNSQINENNKIDDSIDAFSGKMASYLGGCGKGDQTLRDRQTQNLIKHPKLKKIIAHKLKMNEEFTAMVFQMDSKKMYANIVDEQFIAQYCSVNLKMPISLYLDGYQIDTQSSGVITSNYLIEKVHLNPKFEIGSLPYVKIETSKQ